MMDNPTVIALLTQIRDELREQGERQRQLHEAQAQAITMQKAAIENQRRAVAMQRVGMMIVFGAVFLMVAYLVVLLAT